MKEIIFTTKLLKGQDYFYIDREDYQDDDAYTEITNVWGVKRYAQQCLSDLIRSCGNEDCPPDLKNPDDIKDLDLALKAIKFCGEGTVYKITFPPQSVEYIIEED